jgi:hypothetical protein
MSELPDRIGTLKARKLRPPKIQQDDECFKPQFRTAPATHDPSRRSPFVIDYGTVRGAGPLAFVIVNRNKS